MAVVDFTRIDKMLTRAKTMSEEAVWLWSVDTDVKDEIVRMNTIEQLYEQGVDSRGVSLGEYSPVTIMFKQLKGERYDHVTLYDEGDFYASFEIEVKKDSFIIHADDSSKYDRPLFDVYGLDVLGLTDENMEWIKQMILDNYIAYVREQLLS